MVMNGGKEEIGPFNHGRPKYNSSQDRLYVTKLVDALNNGWAPIQMIFYFTDSPIIVINAYSEQLLKTVSE